MVGVVGEGVWYNGQPAGRSDQRTLAGARILVSASENRKGGFEAWKSQGLKVEPMGSVAYKVGLVATGQADATFTPRPRNEWDLCGGVAIVRAAGGRATNGAGEDYTFNRPDPLHHGVMVTNGHLHRPLMDLIRA
jgi:myo-inositol-1(or 4)-monophosphatase